MEEKESEFSRTSEEEQLYKDVLKGNKKTIVDHVKVCLAASSRPQKLLDEVLLPAINDVGAFFDQGRYFLPLILPLVLLIKKKGQPTEDRLMPYSRLFICFVNLMTIVTLFIHYA